MADGRVAGRMAFLAGGMDFAKPRMQIFRAPALDGGQKNLLSGERTHATGLRGHTDPLPAGRMAGA